MNYLLVSQGLPPYVLTPETAAERWGGFTPGKQRGFAAIVSSAKQRSTREQRARKVLSLILDGKNPGGR